MYITNKKRNTDEVELKKGRITEELEGLKCQIGGESDSEKEEE